MSAMATAPTHRKSLEGNPALSKAEDPPMFKVARSTDTIVIPALTVPFFIHEHFSAIVRPRNLREVPPEFLDAFDGCPVSPRGEQHLRRHAVARSVSAQAAVGSFGPVPYIDPHALWYLLGGYAGLQGLAMSDHVFRLNVFMVEDRFGKDRFVYLGWDQKFWDLHIDSMPGRELLVEGDAVFVAEHSS